MKIRRRHTFFSDKICIVGEDSKVTKVDFGKETRNAFSATIHNYVPSTNDDVEQKERPLDEGIIETAKEDEMIMKQRMINKGLKVTEDRESDTYKIESDAVVVGSSCGGGVAAANLAKSGLRVVVLEKGNYFVPRDYSTLEEWSVDRRIPIFSREKYKAAMNIVANT
ncbi:unnamed protein product [Arabis nemorensis]|uniref:Glucose-methanol-choline oxidoreductase N-terminal domain-containing protein n=1 Tax=Arabis nemorensis TaxID=586526 RepID=A0A565AKF6_9BRAS|nr:unnamed protein product [Arabis nemorensis]